MRRREREGKAANGLRSKPARGLARDMGGMVVENDLDRGVGGVGGVEQLEKLDEFAAAVAFLDQGMDVTGEQIDPRHQGQGAVALILVIPHHGRAGAGKWRAIRRSGADRLDPWFLVVRDDGKAPATAAVLAPALAAFSLATQHRHLPVDAEDFGHLGLELGIALFQVVAHLVRLDFLLGQDLADRPLGQFPKARMSGGWSVLTGMRGEQPGGPQLVRVTQLLGLPARQRHQPGFRLGRDYRIASRTRPIIQRLDHPQFRRSLKTACHGLLRHPNRARHGIDRRVFQIGQDNPRPFDTARRFGPRPGNLQQTLPLLRISRQRDQSTRCYHWIPQSNPPPSILPHLVQNGKIKPNILIFWNLYTSYSMETISPPNPAIADNGSVGTQVTAFTIAMSDRSPFTGTVTDGNA